MTSLHRRNGAVQDDRKGAAGLAGRRGVPEEGPAAAEGHLQDGRGHGRHQGRQRRHRRPAVQARQTFLRNETQVCGCFHQ